MDNLLNFDPIKDAGKLAMQMGDIRTYRNIASEPFKQGLISACEKALAEEG